MILTGIAQRIETSAGKTMASWNGIPSGERYLVFLPDGQEESIMLWFPEKSDVIEQFVGQKIQIEGEWFQREDTIDYANTQHPIEYIELPSLEGIEPDLDSSFLDLRQDTSAESTPVEKKDTTDKVLGAWVPVSPRKIFIAQKISLC